MKHKLIISICIVATVATISFSETGLKIFEFAGTTGVYTGTVSEYVYFNKDVLSRLDYKQYAVPYIELAARGGLENIYLSGSFLGAIPLPSCGVLENYDFLTLSSNPTNYSSHDLRVNHRFDIGCALGFELPIRRFAVGLEAGFTYRKQKWTGKDGYIQYYRGKEAVELSWDEPKEFVSGDVINYNLKSFLPCISILGSYSITDYMKCMLDVSFFSNMRLSGADNHILRNKIFYDEIRGGFGVGVEAALKYKMSCVKFGYEKYNVACYGDSQYAEGLVYRKLNTKPGAGSSTFKVSFGIMLD